MAFLAAVSDRLDALRRQRALAQQQLDWFDREIAALDASAPTGPLATPSPATPPGAAGIATAEPAIPDAYTPDPVTTSQEVRRGCLLWAIAVALIFGAVLAAVFFFAYGDRPLFFMDRDL